MVATHHAPTGHFGILLDSGTRTLEGIRAMPGMVRNERKSVRGDHNMAVKPIYSVCFGEYMRKESRWQIHFLSTVES
jgi:hypothetical protein